ncbi:N-acetyltransferase 10 [Nosema bombycis CQ1]|uniref:N-acetyltransferase 10 n=1 Tax=Nosema bombycis (strain CQ1 / CVCC 102059) TaxID=578461 RepID=R0MMN4_NOSB1|nr:N-acetyltransferase 10 [Nosema bombycis CQ1]|eukprot:EOB15475.1 N-acetyltransferase 10 [Nosema bombycis CQ1]
MVEKKIISLFKNSNLNNFRSVMVLIGENSKNQIPVISNLLSKNSYKPVNSIIWCYKNDPQEPEESEEKMKDFYRSKDIQFINYTETEKILGQTVDLLILQDFENLTPNLIALSVETVRGGGLVILLFDKNENLDSIVNTRSELICGEFVPRYNRRLFRSLIKSNFTIFCDSNLKVLPINEIKENNTSENAEKSPVEVNEALGGTEGTLINLGKTQDQKNVLNLLFEAVKDRTERVIYSIQAGRGRGKSVSLGLAISRAIDLKYSSIYVTSPALENVKMVFEFVIKGLESIGYKKYVDFKIVYQFKGKKRLIQRIEFSKGFKQTIEYFNPFDELKYHPDMFIIDEAAAIPLPVLKKLLFPNLIIMATTVSGYEGTGRAFSTKLSEYLKNEHSENDHENPFNYKEIFMNKSIRYGDNDPVEKWLNKTLLLDVEVKPLTKCPIPSGCDLFYVSRDLLFSGSKASEVILRDVFGLFIASHYKNSPNDIQILSDSPNHEIFTLLTTVNDLPRVLCAIHVSFEGRCRGDLLKKGNLIPWIVSETYFNTEILENLGIRIVRIAVHPDYMSMGYGSRALDLLFDFFKTKQNNSLTSLIYKGGDVLFNELNDVMIPKISWIGTSFGVTNKLLNFWKKHSLLPICIKQKVSFVTGEHTLILLKATDDLLEKSIKQYYSYFKKRFIGQLAYSFRDLEPSLCLTLLFNKIENKMDLESIKLSGNDLDRLERYSRNTTDFYQVIDLLPLVSRMYFYGLLEVKLTLLQQSVLMMIGLQCHNIEEVAKFNSLNVFEINSILMKILSNLLPKLK